MTTDDDNNIRIICTSHFICIYTINPFPSLHLEVGMPPTGPSARGHMQCTHAYRVQSAAEVLAAVTMAAVAVMSQ